MTFAVPAEAKQKKAPPAGFVRLAELFLQICDQDFCSSSSFFLRYILSISALLA